MYCTCTYSYCIGEASHNSVSSFRHPFHSLSRFLSHAPRSILRCTFSFAKKERKKKFFFHCQFGLERTGHLAPSTGAILSMQACEGLYYLSYIVCYTDTPVLISQRQPKLIYTEVEIEFFFFFCYTTPGPGGGPGHGVR